MRGESSRIEAAVSQPPLDREPIQEGLQRGARQAPRGRRHPRGPSATGLRSSPTYASTSPVSLSIAITAPSSTLRPSSSRRWRPEARRGEALQAPIQRRAALLARCREQFRCQVRDSPGTRRRSPVAAMPPRYTSRRTSGHWPGSSEPSAQARRITPGAAHSARHQGGEHGRLRAGKSPGRLAGDGAGGRIDAFPLRRGSGHEVHTTPPGSCPCSTRVPRRAPGAPGAHLSHEVAPSASAPAPARAARRTASVRVLAPRRFLSWVAGRSAPSPHPVHAVVVAESTSSPRAPP